MSLPNNAHEGIYLPTKSQDWAFLRPIVQSDREVMESHFKHLSLETRYRRFFAPIKNLTDNQWRYLTQIDQIDHVAWGIVPVERPDLVGVGVGRFVRLEDEPDVAEIALIIRDEMQHFGYGTLLLAVLIWQARRRGLKTLRGIIHPDNDVMDAWTKKLGGKPYWNQDQLRVVDFQLNHAPSDPDPHLYELIQRLERGETGLPDSHSQ